MPEQWPSSRFGDDIGAYWIQLASSMSPSVQSLIDSRLNTHCSGNLKSRQISPASDLLPPIASSDAIASILGALDDKIDLNRRMNETLEAMARAIFKDWFVDFGPTRAKMEGRAPYLAPDIWALFPDRLDDEGKPEGWASRTAWRASPMISNGSRLQEHPAILEWRHCLVSRSSRLRRYCEIADHGDDQQRDAP